MDKAAVGPFTKHLLGGIGIGIPSGILLAAAKNALSPPGVMDLTERVIQMPLASVPSAKGLSADDVSKLRKKRMQLHASDFPGAAKGKKRVPSKGKGEGKKTEKKATVSITSLLSALGGAGIGYAGGNYGTDYLRGSKLDQMVKDRQKKFLELLVQEQMGGGLPKAAAAGLATRPIREVISGISGIVDELPNDLYKMLVGTAAGGGFLYALARSYRAAKEADPARAAKKNLRASLESQLAGYDKTKGGTSPIALKLRSGVGSAPLRKGAPGLVNPSAGRDILDLA